MEVLYNRQDAEKKELTKKFSDFIYYESRAVKIERQSKRNIHYKKTVLSMKAIQMKFLT